MWLVACYTDRFETTISNHEGAAFICAAIRSATFTRAAIRSATFIRRWQQPKPLGQAHEAAG